MQKNNLYQMQNQNLSCTQHITERSQKILSQKQLTYSSANTIMNSLFNSIAQYQDNLSEFQYYIQASVDKNKSIRCKCCETLTGSLAKFKQKFRQFVNQWKNQLPHICQQFMEIVKKICMLYQQQIQKLEQLNAKWEFSYQQLLKAKNPCQLLSASLNHKLQIQLNKQKQIQTSKDQKPLSFTLKNINQEQYLHRKTQPKQVIRISDEIMKIKDTQFSLMRQQITQLFQQQSQLNQSQFIKDNPYKNEKILGKILTEQQKNYQQIKQFRFKTSSNDQQTCILNNLNSNDFNGRLKNIINFSSKNSQQISRKNSVVFKDQFWNSLQNTIAEKPKQNITISGKQNKNLTEKQRLSYTIKQISKEEQRGRLCYNSASSKFNELKKNLYKNKNLSDFRV